MACLNETFSFTQPAFASPGGATFGYADVTVAAETSEFSPHRRPPPSPSPRFQPSPQPFLKHPHPRRHTPTQTRPDPQTSRPSLRQGPGGESPRLEAPQIGSPDHQESPGGVQEIHPDPSSSSLEAAASSAEDADPSLGDSIDKAKEEEEEEEEGTGREEAEGDSGRHSGESAERDDLTQSPTTPTKDQEGEKEEEEEKEVAVVEEQALAVSQKGSSPSGEGVPPGECCSPSGVPPSSSSGTASMEENREGKSPRSSTSDNLQTLSLREHYEVERELGRGTYGKVVLAKCRHTGTQVALKLLPKTSTKLRDFQREFQLSYFLSPHLNIIDTYNVAFETKSSFVFAQEHAPLGDLFDAIPPQLGMREADAKTVIKQLASALDFMHSKHLVHRDIKPENVLVMAVDFSRVKLMDFGMTRKHGTMVRKTNGSIPYTPPEVCEAVRNENILVSASADVWALAVLLFCMLTGNFPWENADIGDMYFKEFVLWQRRKTTKLPSQWRRFSPRAMKFFRKALDVKPERRCGVGEIHKYLSDLWTQKPRTNDSEEDSGSSTSCDHMDELATMLKDHGIETRVDRRLRERRISEWLLSL